MHFCYVLYSPSLKKFYTGISEDPFERLKWHNAGLFEGSYTSQTNDWEIYLLAGCVSRAHSMKVEQFIKQMKSKEFIKQIHDDPEKLSSIIVRLASE